MPGDRTRHPFYFHRLKAVGDALRKNMSAHNVSFPGIDDPEVVYENYLPVPKWIPNSEFSAPPEYDLYAINWKTPFQSSDSNNVTGNPILAEIYRKDPTNGVININTLTARCKGINNGDLLVVESRYGRLEARAYLTEIIHPEVVGISNSYGGGTIQSNPLNRVGPHFNRLLSTDPNTLDAISAGLENAPRIKIRKKENVN
jgi:anaerobic selenocysteine-containing dehydrogenase